MLQPTSFYSLFSHCQNSENYRTLNAQATRAHYLLFDKYLKCRERKIHRIPLGLFLATCWLYQSLIFMPPLFLSMLFLYLWFPNPRGVSILHLSFFKIPNPMDSPEIPSLDKHVCSITLSLHLSS